jgi:CO dehydrogenase/acetyl-CoA synthase alpha subunit
MKKAKLFKPQKSSAKFEFNGRKHIEDMYKSNEWEEYRKRFLDVNTKCYSCGSAATVVDHIEPHKGNILKFEKLDNHLPLCSRCHNTCTALFDRHNIPKFAAKLEWLKKNRIINEVFTRVKVLSYYKRT